MRTALQTVPENTDHVTNNASAALPSETPVAPFVAHQTKQRQVLQYQQKHHDTSASVELEKDMQQHKLHDLVNPNIIAPPPSTMAPVTKTSNVGGENDAILSSVIATAAISGSAIANITNTNKSQYLHQHHQIENSSSHNNEHEPSLIGSGANASIGINNTSSTGAGAVISVTSSSAAVTTASVGMTSATNNYHTTSTVSSSGGGGAVGNSNAGSGSMIVNRSLLLHSHSNSSALKPRTASAMVSH